MVIDKVKGAILQIVPGAPPMINGVGDYAITVARALRMERGIDSTFLVCHKEWNGPEYLDGFRFIAQRSRRSDDLYGALMRASAGGEFAATLLQLSPYGFDANGCPFWLLHALRRWKDAAQDKHFLITYFHELYATSAPWRRAFWVSPMQRFCASNIAKVSDRSITNMRQYQSTLNRWIPSSDRSERVSYMPILSSVGEIESPLALCDRDAQMVVFGSKGLRSRAYDKSGDRFWTICQTLGVREVLDIGPGTPDGIPDRPIIPVRSLGTLGAAEIDEILARSRFGYVDYFPGYLAKSSVFAAYCAHGMVPVLPADGASGLDALEPGTHYWVPTVGSISIEVGQAIATRAHSWYGGHAVRKHAEMLARLIGDF